MYRAEAMVARAGQYTWKNTSAPVCNEPMCDWLSINITPIV